jgi:preprotein translocase subunit Sss1
LILSKKPLNYKVLLVFAPVLILTGILGFILPPAAALTSGAEPYNLFHLIAGALGVLLLVLRRENYIRAFNLGFGLIDLYQALASYLHLFPEEYFQWTRVDDVLHIVIGAGLVSVGLYGFITKR